jgi:DNA-binding NarL/FixJ family response regulator
MRSKGARTEARNPQATEKGIAPPPGLRVFRTTVEGTEYAVLAVPRRGIAGVAVHLTSAQRDVLAMVVEGWPNETIAARRKTSVRTVANQLRTIYAKLGVGSRVELAAWAVAVRG